MESYPSGCLAYRVTPSVNHVSSLSWEKYDAPGALLYGLIVEYDVVGCPLGSVETCGITVAVTLLSIVKGGVMVL